MQYFTPLWQGQEKLWKVFWGGVFLLIALGIIVGVMGAILHMTAMTRAFLHHPLFLIAQLVYSIIWIVLVWKCRNNTSSSAWKWLALLFAVLFVLFNAAPVIVKVHPQPLTAYNPACIKTLEDFASQNGIEPRKYLDSNQTYLQKCTKEFYINTCTKTMEDFAKKNGLNPQDYLKQNQSYLKQCTQSLEDKGAQTSK